MNKTILDIAQILMPGSCCVTPALLHARAIYEAHVNPLENALAKAEADKAALVEALEWLMKAYEMILPGVAKISIPDYALMNDAPCQASAILASVKAQP